MKSQIARQIICDVLHYGHVTIQSFADSCTVSIGRYNRKTFKNTPSGRKTAWKFAKNASRVASALASCIGVARYVDIGAYQAMSPIDVLAMLTGYHTDYATSDEEAIRLAWDKGDISGYSRVYFDTAARPG